MVDCVLKKILKKIRKERSNWRRAQIIYSEHQDQNTVTKEEG